MSLNPNDDIFLLRSKDKSAVELEDFIDPHLLIDAANSLIAKFHGAVNPILVSDLSAVHRTKSLRAIFKDRTKSNLPKVEIAYEILDRLTANPELTIIDKKRGSTFKKVCEEVVYRFKELKR